MNAATKNLEDDHVHILRLLDVMENIINNKNFEIGHIEKIVDIIKNFADGLHHAKEENIFFPLLAERGFSTIQGPVAVMLHEHVQGRNFVKGISGNINLFNNGNKAALNEVYLNMKGYAELLRNHILKENNILFRMADKTLSELDQNALSVRFAESEKNHVSSFDSKEYIKQIKELASYYKV